MPIKDLYPDTLFINLPSTESTDDLETEELIVFQKFTSPLVANWIWYVISGDFHENGEIGFYGYVVNENGKELGYFNLSDLANVSAVPDDSFKGAVMGIYADFLKTKLAGNDAT